MNWYPIFAQFLDTLKMGMKQGLEGETRAQTQDDFRVDTWHLLL
jgi:hypothetical protein